MVDFTTSEKEILCALDLRQNFSALLFQRVLAADLAYLFEKGGHDVIPDRWKAAKYKMQAYPDEKVIDNSVYYFLKKIFRTNTAYTLASLYTSIRLFLVRFDRLLKFFHRSFLPSLFGIAGFSYGIELVLDIGVVLYSAFNPAAINECQQSFGRRCINAIKKDDRTSRMANAAVWFPINFITFWITGGWSSIINLIGFGFDVCHEIAKGCFNITKHQHLLAKIDLELAKKIKKLAALKQHDVEANQKKELIQNKIAVLSVIKLRMEQKIRTTTVTHLYNIFTAGLVVIGMALFFFPPTHIAGISCIGAGLTLGAGSIFQGLGRRVGTCFFNKIGRGLTGLCTSNQIKMPDPTNSYVNSYSTYCRRLLNSNSLNHNSPYAPSVTTIPKQAAVPKSLSRFCFLHKSSNQINKPFSPSPHLSYRICQPSLA